MNNAIKPTVRYYRAARVLSGPPRNWIEIEYVGPYRTTLLEALSDAIRCIPDAAYSRGYALPTREIMVSDGIHGPRELKGVCKPDPSPPAYGGIDRIKPQHYYVISDGVLAQLPATT